MKAVDEIIYDAIKADETLMTTIGGRVVSTCFEVSPTEQDNTPLPYIIVTDDGFQNQQTTKDTVWEAAEDRVQVSVEVGAKSPDMVKRLIRMARAAVEHYVVQLYQDGERTPLLESLSSDGIAWDWTKPCYFQRITYQCTTDSDIEK